MLGWSGGSGVVVGEGKKKERENPGESNRYDLI
jgi:hypothetical protein